MRLTRQQLITLEERPEFHQLPAVLARLKGQDAPPSADPVDAQFDGYEVVDLDAAEASEDAWGLTGRE